jgi:hypothetical protein
VLRHIVLVRSLDHRQVGEVIDALPMLIGKVPGLIDVVIGDNQSPHHQGYDRFFVLEFESVRALDGWANHPAHVPIRDALLRLSEMIVLDYAASTAHAR